MTVTKLSRGALRALRTARTQQPLQPARAGRRGYASAQDTAKQGAQKLGSDLPWLAGSVAFTVVGTYIVAAGHEFKNPFNHPLPGDNWHGEGHDDEEKEGEGEEEEGDGEDGDDEVANADANEGGEEGGDQENGETSGKGQEGQEHQEDGDDSQEDSQPSSGSKLSGKRVPGQPEDNVSRRHGGAWDQPAELEKGPQGQTRLYLPDAKGGVKRRSESARGIVQGRADPDDPESGSIGDVKDGSRSAVAGDHNKFQKGISSTDTKHSYDLMKGDTYSKKSEGVPETAKLTGTVDPRRRGT